jgi:TRAP-type mannitol/chloroaromatic compound transport system permease large subunit
MRQFVTAGSGFLLSVLWFDLMFDVQVRGRADELAEEVLESIAGYYRRVTTAARPMNLLVAGAMLATLGCVIAQVASAERPLWAAWVSLALVAAPVMLARVHTVPSAVRLGARRDTPSAQSSLARTIYRDHIFCFASIAGLLAVQLATG